ncbi:MAG: transposase [bacterium]
MINKKVKENKHRLPLSYYHGEIRVTFTLCVEDKKTLFVQKAIVDKFIEILKEAGNKFNCKNWVYVFMPDHLHLILEGESEQSDLRKTVILFKQKTGFWLSQYGNNNGSRRLQPAFRWQKDFYDHIHRKDDDLKRHVMYILNNPVRKGLTNNWKEYPFSGSLDFDLNEIIF